MKCFNHGNSEAVGICRACGKAICHECTLDLGHSICCKNSCEEKTEILQSFVGKNNAILSAQRRNRYFLPLFFGALGSVYLYFGLQETKLINIASIAGAIFILFGLVFLRRILSLYKEIK